MIRKTAVAFVFGFLVCVLVPAAALQAQEADAQVEKAVERLAGEGDEARKKAVDSLLDAGASAIKSLEDAAWGDDAELAFQAGRVLRMIELGLDPETPDDVRKLAEGFHEPDNETIRPLILQRLTERGEHGLQSIRAIVLSERDENIRGQAFAKAAQHHI